MKPVSNISLSSNIHFAQDVKDIGPKLSAIKKIALAIFEGVTFPFRHLGSKNWSIPGVILRTPGIVFNRIFFKSSLSLKEEMFPSFCQNKFDKMIPIEQAKSYYPHVCSTAFVHQNKEAYIPKGWQALSPKTIEETLPKGTEIEDESVIYTSSGLKISFIEKEDEIIVAFGSLERAEKKRKVSKTKNIAASFMGFIPSAAEQADQFVKFLKDHPYCKGKKITLSGNSYGATLAQYAGLKNDVPAVCFNSFAMGVGLQHSIGKQRLRKADQYVIQITAKGDLVADSFVHRNIDPLINLLGLKTPGNFGKRFMIPSAYTKRMETHGFILGSFMAYLGHDKRDHPADISI